MNTLSNSSALATRPDQITQSLAALSEASSGCQDIFDRNPSLRTWISCKLHEQLIQAREEHGLATTNPEAIYFNQAQDDGSISCQNVTDLLIDNLRSSAGQEAISKFEFYTRHATLDPEHALTSDQNQSVRDMLSAMGATAFADYEHDVRQAWDAQLEDPQQTSKMDTATQRLINLQRAVLTYEIEVRTLAEEFSETDRNRLLSALTGSASGAFSIRWQVGEGRSVELPSTYVLTVSEQAADEPEGAVFLVMPCKGIERFESVDELSAALTLRLSGEQRDPHLVAALPLSDQGRLSRDTVLTDLIWRFTPLSRPLLEDHVASVQFKQAEDLNFLGQQPMLDTPAWQAHVERAQACTHLDDAMGFRFATLTERMAELFKPDWLRNADQNNKDHLLALETRSRQRKRKVDDALRGVETLEQFAEDEIRAYMLKHLGLVIDPSTISVTVNDSIKLGDVDPLAASYQASLLEHAVKGLPDMDSDFLISPVPHAVHAAFSSEFIRRMFAELELHGRYVHSLRARLTDSENLRLMAHHRDSLIALGAQAAEMQGHLFKERSRNFVHFMRGDNRQEGHVYSMGSVHLTLGDSRFKDLIVFEDKTESDVHYVLYAPGAPNGQDFFEFETWRQLSQHVGGWLATEAGHAYVRDQLAGSANGIPSDYLESVVLKPTLWEVQSCVFAPAGAERFEDNLVSMVRERAQVTVTMAERKFPAATYMSASDHASIRTLVEARIRALNDELLKCSPGLISYKAYAHEKSSCLINDFLHREGHEHSLDPDALYVGLGRPHFDKPDFSQHTPLHKVMDLMMYGQQDILSHRPDIKIHCATGFKAPLPVRFITFLDTQVRHADLGKQYMNFLEKEFLTKSEPGYKRRRALMAKRLKYQMIRDALTSVLSGVITDAQYTWLRGAISSLDEYSTPVQGLAPTSVATLLLAGQIVEGVLIFQRFGTHDPDDKLLYTPDSPDGVFFRPLTDFADLLATEAMQGYCYDRVAFKTQPKVGTFLDEFRRGKRHDTEFVQIVNRPENRITSTGQLYGEMVGRMIADVDAQTESVAEQWWTVGWAIVRWTGTILLLPFPLASFGWGVASSTVTLVQAYDAYSRGDRATAVPLLFFGVFGVLNGMDGVRAMLVGTHTALKTLGLRSGLWAAGHLKLVERFPVRA